jgi:hypothetical protein
MSLRSLSFSVRHQALVPDRAARCRLSIWPALIVSIVARRIPNLLLLLSLVPFEPIQNIIDRGASGVTYDLLKARHLRPFVNKGRKVK